MNISVIIPARYQSSRLPGKPLLNIAGKPMIVKTYQQCAKAFDREIIYVATDDYRIKEVCESYDINVIMTSKDCKTGTDRVAECAKYLSSDTFINVQGDEPIFNPDDLKNFLAAVQNYPGEVLNGYCSLEDREAFQSLHVPKVVFRQDERLLYMSRAPIPASKNQSLVKAWRQVCVYAFPRDSLKAYAAEKKKSELEAIEDIEILRFLELGWDVRMIKLSSDSVSVDNPGDIIKVERLIRERGL